jgi:hypothetical protein
MKSWKTTVLGFIGAIATALIPLLQTGSVDTQTLATSVAIAALGVLSKDFDVTGGSK